MSSFWGTKKAPIHKSGRETREHKAYFFHPDYTVGTGVSPVRPQRGSRTLTAGEELHLAPKQHHNISAKPPCQHRKTNFVKFFPLTASHRLQGIASHPTLPPHQQLCNRLQRILGRRPTNHYTPIERYLTAPKGQY